MSEQPSTSRATPKNLYGAAKIAARAAEERKRRDECKEAALEHDRSTKESRAKFAHWANLNQRLQSNYKNSEDRLAASAVEQETIRQEMQEQRKKMKEQESEYEGLVEAGKRNTEISAKYKAYLEMESEQLNL